LIRRTVEFRWTFVNWFEWFVGSGRGAREQRAERVQALRYSRARMEGVGWGRRRREVGIDGLGGRRRRGGVVVSVDAALSSDLETSKG